MGPCPPVLSRGCAMTMLVVAGAPCQQPENGHQRVLATGVLAFHNGAKSRLAACSPEQLCGVLQACAERGVPAQRSAGGRAMRAGLQPADRLAGGTAAKCQRHGQVFSGLPRVG